MADNQKTIVEKKERSSLPQPKQPSVDWKREYESLKVKMNEFKRGDASEDVPNVDKTKLTRMVRGVFRFFDNKGGILKWADRFPWKGAIVKRYSVKDNETVELPFYVAKRLMHKGRLPVFTVTRDSERRPIQRIKEWRRRFEFFPFDEELLKEQRPDLVQVTHI